MAQNDENSEINKPRIAPMKRQRSRSESAGSPPKVMNVYLDPNLLKTLQEYDKNNDGYIYWDTFCEICSDKNIPDDKRNQYWKELVRISTPIEDRSKESHSEDEQEMFSKNRIKLKMKRSKTTKSDIPAAMLLMDEPLRLFETYDLEEDGTLNQTQFEQMLNDLYPKQKQIQMDINIETIDYRENVHDLEVELRRFGGETPNKGEFLKLCVEIFNGKDEIQMQIQNERDERDEKDEIQFVRNIINHFTENVKSGRKGLYSKAKQTIECLSSWIEECGIPNYRENKALRTEKEQLMEEKSSFEKQLCHKKNEEKCYAQYQSELDETNKKLSSDYEALKYRYHDANNRLNHLTNEYREKATELNKIQKDLQKTKQMNEKFKAYVQENKELKNRCNSLQKQLEILNKTHETRVNRLKKENEELQNNNFSLSTAAATTHGMAATAPDTDEDESETNESDDSSMIHQRRYSDDSIPRIHSVFAQSRISDSEQPMINMYAYDHESDFYPTEMDHDEDAQQENEQIQIMQSIMNKFIQEQQQLHSKLNVLLNDYNTVHRLKNELNDKTKEGIAIESLTEISHCLKQKESEQMESLNRIRNNVQQTLVSVRNERNSMKRQYIEYKHNEDILDYIKQNVPHKNDLRIMQQSLCVKAKISTEAIESAQDVIQNAQMEAEVNNATQFSSLVQNIYSMKKQLNHLSDSIAPKHTQQRHIYDDDDDDDDISQYLTLKQQIDDGYEELKQIQLLKEEHKEEKEYEEELAENGEFMKEYETVMSNHEELLLLSQSIKDSEFINSISIAIKKEMETGMRTHRTLIASDLSQNMRFANNEILTKLNESNAKLLEILKRNKTLNAFNDRSDLAIKLYIKNVDDSHKKLLQKQIEETHGKTARERQIAQKFWLQQSEQQMEEYKSYNHDEFIKLYGAITSIKDHIRIYNEVLNDNNNNDDDDDNEDNDNEDNEGSTSGFAMDLIETRIVENVDRSIKENQTSYWKYAGFTLSTALAANFLCIILFFIHKGYHTP